MSKQDFRVYLKEFISFTILVMEHNAKTIKLTNDLFSFFKSELWFQDWQLILKMPKEIPEDYESCAWMIDNISYKYFHATITIFIDNNWDFEELALTIVHEISHLRTLNWINLIREWWDYAKKFEYNIGNCIMDCFTSQYSLINEQMTEKLAQRRHNLISNTKRYKEIKNNFKKSPN